MKFRLSTILLSIAVIAILCGWHLERQSRSIISGVWIYPTDNSPLKHTTVKYKEVLTIKRDGTFTKKEDFVVSWVSYNGTHETDENGVTTFHVTEVLRGAFSGEPERDDVSFIYRCRCNVDSFGTLLVNEDMAWRMVQEYAEGMNDVRWKSYRRK